MSTIIKFACYSCWKKEQERIKQLDKTNNEGKKWYQGPAQKPQVDRNNYKRIASEVEIISAITESQVNANDSSLDEPNKFKGITCKCSVCGESTYNYGWEFTDLF